MRVGLKLASLPGCYLKNPHCLDQEGAIAEDGVAVVEAKVHHEGLDPLQQHCTHLAGHCMDTEQARGAGQGMQRGWRCSAGCCSRAGTRE